MKRIPKLEARIAFIKIKRAKFRNFLLMLIYRAGYAEDFKFKMIKNDTIDFILDFILNSKHYPQIRYIFLKLNKKLDNIDKFKKLSKPIVILINSKKYFFNFSNEEYKILNKRGYIKNGLSILRIFSKIIK